MRYSDALRVYCNPPTIGITFYAFLAFVSTTFLMFSTYEQFFFVILVGNALRNRNIWLKFDAIICSSKHLSMITNIEY